MVKTITVFTAMMAIAIADANPIKLDVLHPPCELESLVASLESRKPIKSEFLETRTNPFQKRPRRFSGMIFWHPDYGLSLEYASPGNTRINVNTERITIYRQDRETRRISVSPDDSGMDVFLKLFAWDTDWITRKFEALAELEGNRWEIQLRPLEDETKRSLDKVELQGIGDLLMSIKLDLAGGKEIGIALDNQEIPWEPDQATLVKQFGADDAGD